MTDYLSATVETEDGKIGLMRGTITYPDLSLAPVKPWIIAYDASDEMKGRAPGGTKESVTGIDVAIQALINLDSPVNGGYRDYLTLDGYRSGNALEANTRTFLMTRRSLVCLWTRSGSTPERYGNTEMRAILNGLRDESARAVVRRIQAAGGQVYVALIHEADGYGGDALNPTLYRMALIHLIEVMVDEAMLIGLSPNNFGVGGLLTGEGMNESLKWRWWDGMPQSLIDSNYVVCFWDTYWRAGQTETFGNRIATQSESPRNAGLTRFVVAETAKVGTAMEQFVFIDQASELLRNGALEGVSFFHSPDGTMSGPAPIRGSALVELGKRMKEFNRVARI